MEEISVSNSFICGIYHTFGISPIWILFGGQCSGWYENSCAPEKGLHR